MSKKKIIIGETLVAPGEEVQINAPIARLPSHTVIDIPVVVYNAMEDGPVLLLMGGLHGDEINGIEVVRRIIENGFHRVKKGAVICIPILNIFGFINFSREVPDGKDVNRSFPGNKNGSLASRIAFHLMKEIIPQIDYGIDFHTGGADRTNYPQIRAVFKDPKNVELASAFCAPFSIDSVYRPKSLRQAAGKKGKKILVYEGGESARFDQYAIEEGIAGTRRLMKHLEMVDEAPEPSKPNIIIKHSTWVRAKFSGLFHSFFKYGQKVKKNEVIGTVTDPFGEFKIPLKSPASGYIVGLNNNPIVHQGDAIVHIGIAKV